MGYLSARFRVAGPQAGAALTGTAFFITNPALLFTVLAKADLGGVFATYAPLALILACLTAGIYAPVAPVLLVQLLLLAPAHLTVLDVTSGRRFSFARDLLAATLLKAAVMPALAMLVGWFVFLFASRYDRGIALARDTALLSSGLAVPALILLAWFLA